ncbi:hypothetical protein ABB37_02812 [Leptomonas pyrrhocoris]|uniref:Uncharacterized protein n=1 Tax=Leptomonas pyrrhocoris TaxID=157538 RepID=A0A0M9G6A2_LEPPY|nr:hypothetical protein ABB37_02812 [Leptomonas pyrrhocoris]KPA83106.1 hypothetical protein ABB37_02812 [Leptomonas pyrrhocoris]|eukprot:XP_015661545.1 hypothetical protein ABB37_02812 [Leptomonas pyrrhocoris]
MAGAASPPSSGPSSLPLSPKVIPFSYDEYVKWLYTAPARSGIGGATGKDVGLQRHMEGAPPSDSAAGAATPSAPPSPLCEIPQHPTPHVDTAASSALPGDEIGYERNFAVATNWEAVVAAPPLVPFTPLLPSVWASRSPDQQGGRVSSATSLLHPGRQSLSVKTAKQGGEADGVGPATPMKSGSEGLTQSPVLQEALRSTSILPAGTSVPAAISMDASQAIFLSSPLHPAVESGQVHTVRNAASPALSPQWGEDAKDEGLRAFVKHFQHGKVHTRPPWFLCSTLLTNCEHPYYVNWLDELQLGSVEEELAWARATQGSVLGDPSQFQ